MKEQIKEKEVKTYNVLNNRVAKVALAASLLLTGVTSTISTVGPSNGIVGEFIEINHAEAASVFAGGTGTLTDPYLVSNPSQMSQIANNLSSHFKLTNNIDLTGVAWVPIGKSSSASFKGSFDGDNFEIRGLKVVNTASYSGLFGYVIGDLKNVHLSNVNIDGKAYVGGLVGYSTGNIKNVSVTGVVNGVSSTGYAGGVVGYFIGSSKIVEEVSSDVEVSSTGPNIGGIVGYLSAGTVRNSYSVGKAFSVSTSAGKIGGVIGTTGANTLVSDVFSSGIVEGGPRANYVGGIVGDMYTSSELRNGYSIASVSGNQHVGGLVGHGDSATYSNLYTLNQHVVSTDAKSAKTFGQLDKEKASVTDIYMPETALGFGQHGYVTNLLTNLELNNGTAYDSLLSTNLWAIDPISKLPYLTFNQAVLEPLLLEPKINYIEKDGFVFATIDSKESFQKLHESIGAGRFLLVSDIDLSGIEWDSIGDQNIVFQGSLDGNGHRINGLTSSKAIAWQGLFGNISGDISNLRLTNANINKAKGYTGVLAGESTGNLKNIYVQGNVNASGNYVGGVVGKHEKGIISNLFADVNVINPSTYTGGITAYTSGVIENSASIGDITGNNNTAGIAGNLGPGGIIRNVYTAGNITGSYYAAGIVGLSSGSLTNAYSIASITGLRTSGGIVADLRGSVESVYALNSSVSTKDNTVVADGSLGKVIGLKAASASVINAVSLDSISGVANDNYITSTINKSEAMRKDSYPWFNSDNTSWAIDDGKSLPYLQLEVNGQYYNPTTGGWMDKPIKDNSEQIKIATISVEKAEKSELQADVLEARTLVNALPSIPEKNSLIARLDIVQKNIIEKEALITQIEAARASVIKAEGSKLQVDVTAGYGLVNLLPVSTEKTNLINRLNVIQKAIDDAKTLANQITIATTSVVKAEGSKLQADVTAARTLVNEIPTSTEKTNLTNRLNKVQESIDLVGKIITATTSVVKAESTKLQSDVSGARTLVNALPSGSEKTNLTNRLNVVQAEIDGTTAEHFFTYTINNGAATVTGYDLVGGLNVVIPDKLGGVLVSAIGPNAFYQKGITNIHIPTSVTNIGESAFAMNKLTTIEIPAAVTFINHQAFRNNEFTSVTIPKNVTYLGNNAFHYNLKLREITVLNPKLQFQYAIFTNAASDFTLYGYGASTTEEYALKNKHLFVDIELAGQISIAKTAVVKAEGSKLQIDVTSALILVNSLPAGNEKTNLTSRLNAVQSAIDLVAQIATATTSVVKAEGTKLQVDVDSARTLVTALPNGTEKTNLTTRLNTVQKAIDDAIALAQQIAVATTSVTKAEGSKTQTDVNSAKTLVNALPNGTEKTNLTTRLAAVQKQIDDAIALANQIAVATTSVSKAEGSKLQTDVNSAKTLVNALPTGTEKTSLTTRLTVVQKAIDDAIALANQVAVATTSVSKAEGSKLQVDVDSARTLVTALPNGTEKTNLTTRLATVQKVIDDAIALANQIATATTSVTKAEGTKLQVDVNSAKTLVNALPTGTEKTNLTTRLNTVQKAIDDAIALANQIATATTSVTKAEGTKLQVDVNSAKTLVNALPNGTEKTNLTTRLNTVQKAIDDAITLAQQIATATTSVVKAEGSKLQVDVDSAKALVTALPTGTEKTNLTTRLNTVQKAIDDAIALANQIATATTSVTKAEGTKLQVDVNSAKTLVSALPNGTEKTSLLTRLNTVQKAIDDAIALANQIAVATTSVSKAEGSKTQVDLDSAKVLVNALPTGIEKTNLTTRLSTLQKAIDDAIALSNQIAVATTSVSKAEGSKLQVDVDSARTLVTALPNGTEKTNLTTRLNTVQKAIDDAIALAQQILTATTSVSKAEGSKLQTDVNTAKALVNALPTGTEKTNLTTRLATVQKAIDDAIALANQIATATTSVSKAEGSKGQDDVDTAKALVNALPSGTEKTSLTNRLNTVQKAIDDAISLVNQIAVATTSVSKAEGSKKQVDVNSAKVLVNALPTSTEKTNLTTRLNTVQKAIDDAIALANQIATATTSVSKAEGTMLQADTDSARTLVMALPNGTEKTDLTTRLNALQKSIDDAIALANQIIIATNSVVKAEGSNLQLDVDLAVALVTGLPNSSKKISLTNRLNAVQKNIDDALALDLAKEIVSELGENPTQEEIDDAKDKIKELSDGPAKELLLDLIDKAQEKLDAEKAEVEENLKQVELATKAVEKSETSETQGNVDAARNLVNDLKNKEVKTELTNRLDVVQENIYNAKALELVYSLVNKLGENPTQEQIDKVRSEVESLSNSEDKTKLREVVDAKQKALDNKIVDAEKMVQAISSPPSQDEIDKAQSKVNLLPVGKVKEELQEAIEKQKLIFEENNQNLLLKATDAVAKAEEFPTNYNISIATNLVASLSANGDKTSLLNRLQEIQDKLAVEKAEMKVKEAENYERDPYLKEAITAVEALKNSKDKQGLQERLQVVLDKLDAEKEDEVIPLVPSEPNSPNWDITTAIAEVVDAEAKLYFTNWNKAVTNAVKYPSKSTIKNAKTYLENLPNSYKLYVSYYYIVDYLKKHTENIDSSNEEPILDVYAPVEQAVADYEKYKTNYYLNKAKELVKALPDSKEKESLEKRLGLHEMPIEEPENAEKLAQLQAAEKAVENYEKYKSSYYQKKAIQAVEVLLDSEEKTAFQNRLNAVRS